MAGISSSIISSASGRGDGAPVEGTIRVEGTDIVWPAPRFEEENEKLLIDAGEALVPVDICGPLTEDVENTGADVRPVDMPPTTCVGGTEKDALPTTWVGGTEKDALPTACVGGTEKDALPKACVGGTEKDGLSSSMGELSWKEEDGPCW